jgi:hypothetical protein
MRERTLALRFVKIILLKCVCVYVFASRDLNFNSFLSFSFSLSLARSLAYKIVFYRVAREIIMNMGQIHSLFSTFLELSKFSGN